MNRKEERKKENRETYARRMKDEGEHRKETQATSREIGEIGEEGRDMLQQ